MASVSETVKRIWHEDRPKVVWGTVLGGGTLVILVGACLLYDALVSPPMPALDRPQAVAEYLGHAWGWRKLSVPKRKEWLGQVVQANATGRQRKALAVAFRRLPKADRRVFMDGFLDIMMPEVLADARVFNRTPRRQRNDFLRKKLQDFGNLENALRGNGGASTDLLGPFGAALPSNASGWTKTLVQKTSPTDRATMKPYIDELTSHAKWMKQQAQAAAPRSTGRPN